MKTYVSFLGLVPHRIGGTEVFVRELSAQLGALGWRSVLCFLAAPEGVVRDYLTLPNVVLETLPGTVGFGHDDLLHGISLLRRYRPEILHLQYANRMGLWPRIAQFMGTKRIYLTDHSSRPAGYVPGQWKGWKQKVTRMFMSPISGVVTVSDYGTVCMRGLGVLPPESVRRIYNSVDLNATGNGNEFRERFGIPQKAPLITQVCNMIPEKGVKDLLDAARIVVNAEPSARFALVGRGPQLEEYRQYAAALGLSEQVAFTGSRIDPIREGAYAAADITCQVSVWEELFGFVIAEAMAASRPVIGTRVGGIPELINEGETGFLVTRSDVPAIADRILRLIADPGLRARMGAAGRIAAEEKFDVHARVRDMLEFAEVLPAAMTARAAS